MRRAIRIAPALAVALAVLFLQLSWAGPARACSCVDMRDPQMLADALDFHSAGFVGTALTREVPSPGAAVWVFEVESVIKGQLPERIDVRSAEDGAACGIEMQIGQRGGLLLTEADGAWEGSLCGQVSADALLAAGDPQPPTGDGQTDPPPPLAEGTQGSVSRAVWIGGGAALLAAAAGAALAVRRGGGRL